MASWRPARIAAIGARVRDRLILPLMAIVAAAIVVLALVWPQGSGQPSPAPFGHAMGPAGPSPR
jgi:hypothetical protein